MYEIIKNNIFVMTRTLTKDYHFMYKPLNLNENDLLRLMEQTYFNLNKSGIFTSEWYTTSIKGTNNPIAFRIVVDGRSDDQGRYIRRYEGSIIPAMTKENISILEQCLQEFQKESNNYKYGFEGFNIKSDQNKATQLKQDYTNKKIETGTIEFKNDKIIIKSNILSEFLKEHSYVDLLKIIQIETNSIDRNQDYKKIN